MRLAVRVRWGVYGERAPARGLNRHGAGARCSGNVVQPALGKTRGAARSIDRLRLHLSGHLAGGVSRQAEPPDARNRFAVEWTKVRGAPFGRGDYARGVA